MRLGLRLQGKSCRTIVLDGHKVVSEAVEYHGADLAAALDSALRGLPRRLSLEITDITADVSRALAEEHMAPVVAIRISPRPPADPFHVPGLPAHIRPAVTREIHVAGGHDLRGRPLAPLAMEAFLAELPKVLPTDARNVAITAVGAMASTDHETRIADAILSRDSEMRVSISSDFPSSAFRDRDYTAVLNSALMETGEKLAAMLEEAGKRYCPAATISFSKNDGGRAPLARLALFPIRGLRPEPALQILGAATLSGVPDGEIIICTDSGITVGHIRGGLPVTRSLVRQGYEASLASNAAVVESYTANHHVRPAVSSVVTDLRTRQESPLPFGLIPTLTASHDIDLVGSAATPLTAWIDRLGTVSGRRDLERVQHSAEEDARSAVVQQGAGPNRTSIIESNVFAMAYGYPGIVRIRVQAAGDTSEDLSEDAPLLSKSEWGAAS